MADKLVNYPKPETGEVLCLVEERNGEYRGYKKDILIENLSERENTMFVCIRCQGIMKMACTSSGGEQFCSCCKTEGEQTHPNLQTDNMVLSFKCSCPLIARGCRWLGNLGNCANHLDTCVYVYEACKLNCGEVLQRDDLDFHQKENCPQRIVKCEHCCREFKSCELFTHLDMCPKMKVSCGLNCGKVMCREDIAHHLEQDCVEKEVMCPFAKYKCVALIKRKDLNKHLEERRIEHLELRQEFVESEVMVKQKEKNYEQSATIETMSREITSLKKERFSQGTTIEFLSREIASLKNEMETLANFTEARNNIIETMSREVTSLQKQVEIFAHLSEAGALNIPIKLEWRITKVPDYNLSTHTQEQFQVSGYELKFNFRTSCFGLQILISTQSGCNYEKLRWPFKAEFITRLSSRRNPSNSKKFKSEVFSVKREDFNSVSSNDFRIATISRGVFLEHFIDGEAFFEIIVFLLL